MSINPSEKAALRGEPSYVWREGQQRRLDMILAWAGERIKGSILENGCGVGMYVSHLSPLGGIIFGLEYDYPRAKEAAQKSDLILNAAGENLPYPANSFDLILSHEVIEHVQVDTEALKEMARVLRPGGRITLFCPNRWYPVETHGIYWKGEYHFGNIPLVNYLPRGLRDKLAPHVEVYTRRDLNRKLKGLPVKVIYRNILFGGYDNLIAHFGVFGRILRRFLQLLEKTPLKIFGLSHFWVIEKV
ncbi:MAG: class I SAM-dependent methyltransferase [Anaerolineales bacterium]|nr:class I SAM-dependent methyltransferase [Anaerolineales bacterium]